MRIDLPQTIFDVLKHDELHLVVFDVISDGPFDQWNMLRSYSRKLRLSDSVMVYGWIMSKKQS